VVVWLRGWPDDKIQAMLTRRKDFSVVVYPCSEANFIGGGQVRADGVEIGPGDVEQSELRGRIVLMLQADPRYDSTNMVSTLLCAAPVMLEDADLLIAYGDIVYEPRVLALYWVMANLLHLGHGLMVGKGIAITTETGNRRGAS